MVKNKKEQIISLIEEMDEEGLDKLLYFIKLQLKKRTITNITSSLEANNIWKDVCMIIERELTEVSYNTWIQNIIPVSIEENIFTLAVGNEFQLGIIKGRYSNLIKTALLHITDIKFELEYMVVN